MLEHTHTGTELTLVLEGSFSHEGGRFGPGDFGYGDDEVDHRPIVGDEGPCLCLVAMTGDLRMNGFLSRWLEYLAEQGHSTGTLERDPADTIG